MCFPQPKLHDISVSCLWKTLTHENMYIWPTSMSINTLKYSLSILITLLLALHLWALISSPQYEFCGLCLGITKYIKMQNIT